MTRSLIARAAFVSLIALLPVSAGAQTPPNQFDGQRALAHVRALATDIGPRVSGTAGEEQAVRYIAAQFASSGYAVELVPFTVTDNPFRAGTVTVGDQSLTGQALAGSAMATVSGPSTFVGLADRAGIGTSDLTGRVAVADRGTLRFGEKLAAARAAGATALVIVNTTDELFNGDLGPAASIPVIGVRLQDGVAIRSAARAGEPLTVGVEVADQAPSTDVVARPIAGAACDIIVGGHHDTVPLAPGANDNASGAASVMEAARTLASEGGPLPGICFATFGGEESGLYGSAALAGQMNQDGALPRLMVNLDVTGIGETVQVIGDPDLTERVVALGRGLGIPTIPSRLPPNIGSDHQSFARAGVPVVFLTSGNFSTIHTPNDVLSDLDPGEMTRVGTVAVAAIRALAAQPTS